MNEELGYYILESCLFYKNMNLHWKSNYTFSFQSLYFVFCSMEMHIAI